MADIKEKMEDIIRQEGGEIREKSAADGEQRAESVRATASDSRSDKPKGDRELERERERERESVEAERSGDIGSQPEEPETKTEEQNKKKKKDYGNLRPTSLMTEAEQREFARKGGLASAAARRKKKNLQDMLGALLSSPATPEMKEKAASLGINVDNLEEGATLYDALCVAMLEKALTGDGYAFQLIRDSAGDKPKDQAELSVGIMTDKDKEVMAAIEARMKGEKSANDGQ